MEDARGIYSHNLSTGEVKRIVVGSAGILSPDGRLVAFRTPTGAMDLIRIDGTGRRELAPSPAAPAAWSPDGSMILYFLDSDPHFHVVEADGTNDRALAQTITVIVGVAWTPAGIVYNEITDNQEGTDLLVSDPFDAPS
jgi:roadblock/LC7 domain-containing protein